MGAWGTSTEGGVSRGNLLTNETTQVHIQKYSRICRLGDVGEIGEIVRHASSCRGIVVFLHVASLLYRSEM